MVDSHNGETTNVDVENTTIRPRCSRAELDHLCTPLPGNNVNSKKLDAYRDKMQLLHARMQQEQDRILERQSQLLVSMQHEPTQQNRTPADRVT